MRERPSATAWAALAFHPGLGPFGQGMVLQA